MSTYAFPPAPARTSFLELAGVDPPGPDQFLLLALTDSDDEADISFRLLDEHPLLALAGHRASPETTVLAIFRSVPGHEDPAAQFVSVFDRSQSAAPVPELDRDAADAESALILDVLSRCLGLDTPPPPSSTDDLWQRVWLDTVADFALLAPGTLDWATAARCHPAIRAGAAVPSPIDLASVGRRYAAAVDWTTLHAGHGPAVPGGAVGDHVRRWMDVGMFARWVSDAIPSIGELLEPLEATIPPPTMIRIVETLDAWLAADRAA